jgi:tetratricopeptide (TPR) repeat protein
MLCEALMPLHPAPSATSRVNNASRNDCHFSFTRVTIWADDMIATINSRQFRSSATFIWPALLGLVTLLPLLRASGPTAAEINSRLKRNYTASREVLQKSPAERDAAWQFARACFDLAEVDEANRAKIAEEAIDACRKSLQRNTNAGNYYYLALNLGQLARTRTLGALKLVSEMEVALKSAIEVDPRFDFAGPHRTLGMLYRDAPGWPASIGSRSKAKQQLLKAIELVPDYPDNQISLIESYIQWGELKNARGAISNAESPLRQARLKLMGERWRESWRDWDQRWERIRRKTNPDLSSPRGSR